MRRSLSYVCAAALVLCLFAFSGGLAEGVRPSSIFVPQKLAEKYNQQVDSFSARFNTDEQELIATIAKVEYLRSENGMIVYGKPGGGIV